MKFSYCFLHVSRRENITMYARAVGLKLSEMSAILKKSYYDLCLYRWVHCTFDCNAICQYRLVINEGGCGSIVPEDAKVL